MKLLFIVIAISILTISSCLPNKSTINFHKTDLRYLEYVHENPSCDLYCLKEYIVISNGMIFSKVENQKKNMEVSIGRIDPKNAESIISEAKDITLNSNNEGISCRHCNIYHVFYGDKDTTLSLTTKESDSLIDHLEDSLREEAKKQLPEEPFFVHFVYKKLNENTVDYHLYQDGIVLKEQFGEKNGELLNSEVLMMQQSEINDIKNIITPDFFIDSNDLETCYKTGFEWGYVEIQHQGQYGFVYTCSEKTTQAGRIFSTLLDKTGGIN